MTKNRKLLKLSKNGWIWYLKVLYIIWQSFRSVGRVFSSYYLYLTHQTILTRKITILNVVLKRGSKKLSSCSNFTDSLTLRGRLQRTSAKISDFQTTTPPLVRVCPNFQNHPPSPDVRVRIFQFLHIFQFLPLFNFCSLKHSLLPNSCFYKV